MAHDTHDHPDDGGVHVHVHHWKFYAGILGILLFLTIATVAVSYVDIDGMLALGRPVEGVGAWNLFVAIAIATMKATFVVLFFMHLRDDARFNALIFVGSLAFVGIFFAYTMNDTMTRGTTADRFNGVQVDPETGERAPGGINRAIPGEELEEGLPESMLEALEGHDAHGAEGEAHEGDGEHEADAAHDEGAADEAGEHVDEMAAEGEAAGDEMAAETEEAAHEVAAEIDEAADEVAADADEAAEALDDEPTEP